MTTVDVVVPDTIDDPEQPSGGNTYDRRVCAGLAALGWSVRLHPVPGRWPQPDVRARSALSHVLAALPGGAVTLVDGLIASCASEVLLPETGRLRLVVLVHMPLGDRADVAGRAVADEPRVLAGAAAVVTTSAWTRHWLLDRYALDPARVHVAEPGADAAALARGTPEGTRLLCVAAVTHDKGHDQLLTALTMVSDLSWRCLCVGAPKGGDAFVQGVVHHARRSPIADRVCFAGPLAAASLDHAYAASDLLVHPSRAETYGLVVTEALARGLPVVAMEVGGVPEALGHAPDGAQPGLLVRPGDVEAFAGALRSWLTDGELRERLRDAARGRRLRLSPWSVTSRRIADVLTRASA